MGIIIRNNTTIKGGVILNKPQINSGGGIPQNDSLYGQLTTSRSVYTAATTNNWVRITQTEYNNIFNNIQGAIKRGNTDAEVANRAVSAGFTEVTFGVGNINTPLTINVGEYPIAFVSETWNGNANVRFGYSLLFHSGTPIYDNAVLMQPVQRNYYLRKSPSDVEGAPATQTLYPTLKIDGNSFNLVPSTVGWYTNDGGVTWLSNAFSMAKFQMIVTTAKTW